MSYLNNINLWEALAMSTYWIWHTRTSRCILWGKILAQKGRLTLWNGHKCGPSIITSRRNVVTSNIWHSGIQYHRSATSLWWLCKIKSKITCSINNTYTRAPIWEIIFLDTDGQFPDSLIVNLYWIGVVYYYSRYSWGFFTKTKLQLSNIMK